MAGDLDEAECGSALLVLQLVRGVERAARGPQLPLGVLDCLQQPLVQHNALVLQVVLEAPLLALPPAAAPPRRPLRHRPDPYGLQAPRAALPAPSFCSCCAPAPRLSLRHEPHPAQTLAQRAGVLGQLVGLPAPPGLEVEGRVVRLAGRGALGVGRALWEFGDDGGHRVAGREVHHVGLALEPAQRHLSVLEHLAEAVEGLDQVLVRHSPHPHPHGRLASAAPLLPPRLPALLLRLREKRRQPPPALRLPHQQQVFRRVRGLELQVAVGGRVLLLLQPVARLGRVGECLVFRVAQHFAVERGGAALRDDPGLARCAPGLAPAAPQHVLVRRRALQLRGGSPAALRELVQIREAALGAREPRRRLERQRVVVQRKAHAGRAGQVQLLSISGRQRVGRVPVRAAGGLLRLGVGALDLGLVLAPPRRAPARNRRQHEQRLPARPPSRLAQLAHRRALVLRRLLLLRVQHWEIVQALFELQQPVTLALLLPLLRGRELPLQVVAPALHRNEGPPRQQIRAVRLARGGGLPSWPAGRRPASRRVRGRRLLHDLHHLASQDDIVVLAPRREHRALQVHCWLTPSPTYWKKPPGPPPQAPSPLPCPPPLPLPLPALR